MKSVLNITRGADNKLSSNTGYGIVYGWSTGYIEETDTQVTLHLQSHTHGTSKSSLWRGPEWSGVSIQAGAWWYDENGTKQEKQSPGGSFSYYYDAQRDSNWLVLTFNRRATSDFDVALMFDTDGSLPNLIDWVRTGTLTVARKIAYTVTYYDGDTKLATLDKYHDTPLTLNCTEPSKAGYTFLGWSTTSTATTADADYDNGKTYSANANLILYAVWKRNIYTISYDGNKPSDASSLSVQRLPSSDTKYWMDSYTVKPSANPPYLLEHQFLGYSISSDGSVTHQPGNTFNVQQNVTLYCNWKRLYTEPTVSNVKAVRVNSSGTPTDDGEYLNVTFNWSICPAANEDPSHTAVATNPRYNIRYKIAGTSGASTAYYTSAQPLTGKSGSVSVQIGKSGVLFEPTNAYEIDVYVYDTHNVNGTSTTASVTSFAFVQKASYIFDIANQGKRLGLGIAAPSYDGMEVAYKTTFLKNSSGAAEIDFEDTNTDANSTVSAHIGTYRRSDSAGVRVGARRGDNGCDIYLGVKGDGTPHVYMDDGMKTAFKEALSFGDYVVEQATSGIWTYRKWNSGVLEAWTKPSFNTEDLIWTNWSGVFKFTPIVVNFPSNLFSEAANVEATPQIQGSAYSVKLETNSKDSFTLAIIAADGVALAEQTFYVHIQAKGRWK